MKEKEFESALDERAKKAEQIVLSYLPKAKGAQEKIYEAMAYSLQSGGKRLRPLIMLESFRLFAGEDREQEVYPFMAALEMIHTYSLIHDDLPAMDNDDLRRGRPTNHIVFGEAMAILAGDSLLNLAFETAASAYIKKGGITAEAFSYDCNTQTEVLAKNSAADAEYLSRCARAIFVLGQKAGCRGMIGGQVADILAEEAKEPLGEEGLVFIHEHKTAALLQAALMIGAIMGGAGKDELRSLETIGYNVGLAFQIRDDILDVTGSQQELGKPIGSDERNEKSTYVTLHGIEKADEKVKQLSEEAESALSRLEGDTGFLKQLFAYLTERNK